jgi:hypothetical protein
MVGKLDRKRHLEDLGVDGKIIIDRILGNKVGMCGLDSTGSG